jgi:hypothetical protein
VGKAAPRVLRTDAAKVLAVGHLADRQRQRGIPGSQEERGAGRVLALQGSRRAANGPEPHHDAAELIRGIQAIADAKRGLT